MSYALRTTSGPVELPPERPIILANLQFSYDTMLSWFDADRAAQDILPIVEPAAIPAGKVMTGSTLSDDGTTITRVPVLADAPLGGLQASQIATLSASCAAQIVGGFTSSALGAVHTYPSKTTDQANLSASVLSSLMPNLPANWTTPFWCADGTGAWSYQNHTVAQIQQAGLDGKAAILAAQVKLATLSAEIAAATTVAAVDAITW